MTGRLILVADIGGTNARFAVSQLGELGPSAKLAVADYETPIEALEEALKRLNAGTPGAIRLAVAGVVKDDTAVLTNGTWRFHTPTLMNHFEAAEVSLYNDVQAAALGLPFLHDAECTPLGGPTQSENALPKVLIMAGTGLGVSSLIYCDGQPYALATEAGHTTLAGSSPAQVEILSRSNETLEHVSPETVLSGQGLSHLYHTCSGGASLPPEGVVEQGLNGDPIARKTLETYSSFLGSIAGNLALSFGAWGGVYISGGVPQRFTSVLQSSEFRSSFEIKGRFCEALKSVPTTLIASDDLALRGLAFC